MTDTMPKDVRREGKTNSGSFPGNSYDIVSNGLDDFQNSRFSKRKGSKISGFQKFLFPGFSAIMNISRKYCSDFTLHIKFPRTEIVLQLLKQS